MAAIIFFLFEDFEDATISLGEAFLVEPPVEIAVDEVGCWPDGEAES